MDGIDALVIDDILKEHVGQKIKELIQNGNLIDKWIKLFQDDHKALLKVYNDAFGLERQSLNMQAKKRSSVKRAYLASARTKETEYIYTANKSMFFIQSIQEEYRKCMIKAQYDLIDFREWFTGQTQNISVHFAGDLGNGIDKKELNLTLKELYSTYSFLVDIKIGKNTLKLDVNIDAIEDLYIESSDNKIFASINNKLFKWIQYLVQQYGAVDAEGNGIEWMTYEIYTRYKNVLGGKKKGKDFQSTSSGVFSSFILFLSNYVTTQLSNNDNSKYDTGLMGGDAGTLTQAKYTNEKNKKANSLTNQFIIIGQLENLITGLKQMKNENPEGFYRATNTLFNGGDAEKLRNKVRNYVINELGISSTVLNKI